MDTAAPTHHSDHSSVQHKFFDLVVILKGLNGLLELLGGGALLLLPAGAILTWAAYITQTDPSTDPTNYFARAFFHWAQHFGHDTQLFAGIYLLAHGLAKTTLATLLLIGQKIAYPIAIVFFSAFACYLAYRLAFHHFSWILAAFVAFDIFTVIIIAREWQAEMAARAV